MEIVLKAAGICLAGAVIAAVIKKDSPAIAMMLSAAAAVTAIFFALGALGDAVDFVSELADKAGMSAGVLSAVLKSVGIAIVSQLAADVCADAGMKAAVSGIEIAGAAAALFVSMPMIKTVYSMIDALL